MLSDLRAVPVTLCLALACTVDVGSSECQQTNNVPPPSARYASEMRFVDPSGSVLTVHMLGELPRTKAQICLSASSRTGCTTVDNFPGIWGFPGFDTQSIKGSEIEIVFFDTVGGGALLYALLPTGELISSAELECWIRSTPCK